MALPPVGEPGTADPHVAQLTTAAFAVLMLAQKARAAAAEASFKRCIIILPKITLINNQSMGEL
jgi:hypothetical protein